MKFLDLIQIKLKIIIHYELQFFVDSFASNAENKIK